MEPMQVLAAIQDGVMDDYFEAIFGAVKDRRRTLDARKSIEFKVGDSVVFNEQASPKYLRGCTAKVTGRAQKNLLIKLDEDCGRYRAGVEIRCPVAIIEAVPA